MANKKVNFMILGAMKCGTSSLASILKLHPDIGFCKYKEPDFFSRTNNWKENIHTYHNLFDFNKGKVFGEASTNYSKYPSFNKNIWNDLYDYNSKLKFIYIVRNPVDRAISQYMHDFERGYTNLSINEHILNPNIINIGRYYTQIRPFIEKFGHSQILIIEFDELISERANVLKNISVFLNIDFDKFKNYEDIHKNKTLGGNKITVQQEKYIKHFKILPKSIYNFIKNNIFNNSKRKFYQKPELEQSLKTAIVNLTMLDIIELEKITGKDFSKWKKIE